MSTCARCRGGGAYTKASALSFCHVCALRLHSGLDDPFWRCPVDAQALRAALARAFGWCERCLWPKWKCAEIACPPADAWRAP